FAGCSCECAITQLAARRRVNDETVIGFAAFSGHVPLLSGGADQHLARLCACFPHGLPGAADAGAAASSLIAEQRASTSLLDLDLLPVSFEFLSKDHRQRCAHALTHLGASDNDRDLALRRDGQICVGSKRSGLLGVCARGKIEADDQSSRSG